MNNRSSAPSKLACLMCVRTGLLLCIMAREFMYLHIVPALVAIVILNGHRSSSQRQQLQRQ